MIEIPKIFKATTSGLDKEDERGAIKLEKNEVIEILKTLEGLKRKLQVCLK